MRSNVESHVSFQGLRRDRSHLGFPASSSNRITLSCLALIVKYRLVNSAQHGSYGLVWLIKDLAFPNPTWQHRITIGGGINAFLGVPDRRAGQALPGPDGRRSADAGGARGVAKPAGRPVLRKAVWLRSRESNSQSRLLSSAHNLDYPIRPARSVLDQD